MDALPIVKIVRDERTGGYGLSIFRGGLAAPRLLLPFRMGQIFFAEALADSRILILAEDRRTNQSAFWAIVDLSEQIVCQSQPFGYRPLARFYLSSDRSVVITAETMLNCFMYWDVATLTLKGSWDCLQIRNEYLEFDSYRNYFVFGNETGASIRNFHSSNIEIEFNKRQQSGLLISCYNLGTLIGQLADGSFVFLFRKGGPGSLEDDGFLIVSPSDWRATKASTYGRLIKKFDESLHEFTEMQEFEHLALKAATVTLVLPDKSYESYIHALEYLSSQIEKGVDALRFGYVLRVCFVLGNRPLNDDAVRNDLARSSIDDILLGTDYSPRITSALASVIRSYVTSMKSRIDAWDRRSWLLALDVKSMPIPLVPA